MYILFITIWYTLYHECSFRVFFLAFFYRTSSIITFNDCSTSFFQVLNFLKSHWIWQTNVLHIVFSYNHITQFEKKAKQNEVTSNISFFLWSLQSVCWIKQQNMKQKYPTLYAIFITRYKYSHGLSTWLRTLAGEVDQRC